MFMPELVRMLAIDLTLLLSLILTTRIAFSSRRGHLLIQAGIALLLVEDAIRWTIGIAIGFVSAEAQVGLDLIRQWVSLVGATGAILACAALLPIVARRYWTSNANLASRTP
jgi:hypothetical protein